MDVNRFENGLNGHAENLSPHVEAAKRRLESLNEQTGKFIKDHTVGCVVSALALGYVVARFARRNNRSRYDH